jgi:uncharacterized membrane protein YphA (DoxX/SURF4 family)
VAKLNLQVLVDVKGQEKLTGIGAGLSRTGANLTKFVTLPLLGVGAAATAMALEAEKSGAKLTAAFKNMGKTTGKTLTQLEQQADDLGQVTIFDDEQIKEAQAALITFGTVSGEAFDRALEASLDFAAATGKDATAATQALGKALADPVAGLSRLGRMGVIFTDQQKEQVAALVATGDTLGAQEVILAAFESRYKSTNETLQSTAAGQAAQGLEDLQNAGEDLGAVFLPILADLAKGLSGLARWFTDLPAPMQTFIATFGVVLAAIGPAAFVIGKLVGAFRAVIVVFNLLKIALLTNPFTALAVAVAAIAALIILNWDKIWAVLQAIWKKITDTVGGLVKSFASAWGSIVSLTTAAWESVGNIIRGVINFVIDMINGFFGFLNGIVIPIPSISIPNPFGGTLVQAGGGSIDPFNIGLIPHLAAGGIVNQPTLALLGESGSEAVVPLNSTNRLGDVHYHVDVRGEEPFIRNETDLTRTLQRTAFLAGF